MCTRGAAGTDDLRSEFGLGREQARDVPRLTLTKGRQLPIPVRTPRAGWSILRLAVAEQQHYHAARVFRVCFLRGGPCGSPRLFWTIPYRRKIRHAETGRARFCGRRVKKPVFPLDRGSEYLLVIAPWSGACHPCRSAP